MTAQQPYPGFPSYLNSPRRFSLRSPLVIAAAAIVLIIAAVAVYFVAFASASDETVPADARPPANEELAAALPTPTETPEPTATNTPTPEPTAYPTPLPLFSPSQPASTPTPRARPEDDRIIVFTLADMPNGFLEVSDMRQNLPNWDRPFFFENADTSQIVAAHTIRLASEEDERAFDEMLAAPGTLTDALVNNLRKPFTELYVTGPLDKSYPSQTIHGATMIEGQRIVLDAVAFRIDRAGGMVATVYSEETGKPARLAPDYAEIMAERLGYKRFNPLLRGPYELPKVSENFFPAFTLRSFSQEYSRIESIPENVPMFVAGTPSRNVAFARESPYELVIALGYPVQDSLIREIRNAASQPLFEPHQVVESERIGDDSITVTLVTEETRFEVTLFRLAEYEYLMAVQTNGSDPYHYSRHLARRMRDAIVTGG